MTARPAKPPTDLLADLGRLSVNDAIRRWPASIAALNRLGVDTCCGGARLVVFRITAGQAVAPHRSASTVTLAVLEGAGTLSGGDGERACAAGDLVVYAPEELHGMRADRGADLLLLATITPRPGERPAAAPQRAA